MPISLNLSLPQERLLTGTDDGAVLIARCIKGDARAQRTFYEAHYRLVLGITSRYALDQQQAKDFLNQTFLTVFRSLEKFRNDGEIGAWIRKICVNVCLGQLRIRRNQSYAELPANNNQRSANPAALQKLAVEDLVTLIRQLPEVPRTVFNLTAVEGYSHREAAKRLGIEEATSRYHLRQARLRLQAAVNKLNVT
ncbi:MAG: sigma-70 family RNA polymerase sigma factor [Bacteroidota bacterium]